MSRKRTPPAEGNHCKRYINICTCMLHVTYYLEIIKESPLLPIGLTDSSLNLQIQAIFTNVIRGVSRRNDRLNHQGGHQGGKESLVILRNSRLRSQLSTVALCSCLTFGTELSRWYRDGRHALDLTKKTWLHDSRHM